MDYKQMIDDARKSGNWSEKMMIDSVNSIADLLECVKKTNKEAYWHFMREQAGIMNGGHYDKVWADYDVSQIAYTDKEGKKHTGAYWTCEQIEEATKGMTFPSGTTKWDRFVAFNVFWSDTCKVLTDEQILKAAYQFYFADEDYPKERGAKIWSYMAMVHQAAEK